MLRMAEPIIHHRHPEFAELFTRVCGNLRYVFQTKHEVFTLTSSGTGAMEAVVCNIHSPGETALYVNGGKFGERWGEILRAYGINAVEVKVEWGDSVLPRHIEAALEEHPHAKAVYLTHSETSTGAATDVRAIARIAGRRGDVLTIVDGITAVGAMELRMDEWGIDCVVTGSQKGLMIPPGLAFLAVSPKAWERVKSSRLPRYYFDLRAAQKALEANDTPWTPAISLVVGLDAALTMIRQEGIERVWARHARLGTALRAAVQAVGLQILAKEPSNALTAIRIPESVDSGKFSTLLKKTYGITAAGGQGHLAGRIVRISHLGYYDELDMVAVISAIEMALTDCGFVFERGAGIRAAQESFARQSS